VTVSDLRKLMRDVDTVAVFIGFSLDSGAVFAGVPKSRIFDMLKGRPPGTEVRATVTSDAVGSCRRVYIIG